MTTVVAAFIPWKSGEPTANGVVMVADLRLSVEESPGVYKTWSDAAEKIFKVTPYMMVGYSGHRRAARIAIKRLERDFPIAGRLPGNLAELQKHMKRSLRKGAAQSRRSAMTRSEKASTGPFQVFVAFQNDKSEFGLFVHQETFGHRVVEYSGIADADGRPRILLMGSGHTAVPDFLASLNRISADIEAQRGIPVQDLKLQEQAGIAGMALLDILLAGKAAFSGGGLQGMWLTDAGVQGFELMSSVPEYLTDRTVDPQWEAYRPAQLTE